jgi:apolipoprotein N-acyltransferase
MTTPLSIIFCLIVIPLIFGVIRISDESSGQNAITVGLAVLDERFHSETNHPNFDSELRTTNMYADAVAKLAKQGAQIVVLPEKIVNATHNSDSSIKGIIVNAASKNRIAVIAGYTEFVNDSLKRNKSLAIAGDGIVLADYEKVNLFEGEARNGFAPGKEIAAFNLNNTSSGVAICKDLDFQDFMRKYHAHDVQILYVPAWDFIKDGWLHSRMAILRGVENGYAIVRAARQGHLTISDYRGKVLYEASSTNNNAATLIGKISPKATKTIYSRFGDWFGVLNLIAAFYFILFAARKKVSVKKL